MNIEPNTLLIGVLAGFSITFGIGYIRALMRERMNTMTNRINELENDYWREHEKIYSRINSIERCCKTQEKCDKNFYNTGA